MNVKRHEGHEREMPHAHIYHAILPIAFFLIWILDSNIFRISIFLNNFVPFLIRLLIWSLVLIIALTFIMLSHQALFKSHQPANSLITDGILRYVRNPNFCSIYLFVYFINLYCSFRNSIFCI